MNNLSPTKEFLNKALNNLPADFAIQEVRSHIRHALQKLEHVEKKRSSRETVQKTQHATWHEMINNGVQNPNTPQRTIDIINQMIAEEKAKLDDIKTRKSKIVKDTDNLDTLFD
jgi:thiamine pyrophosphate-dependent acetolactate synthase large subunit-like protein